MTRYVVWLRGFWASAGLATLAWGCTTVEVHLPEDEATDGDAGCILGAAGCGCTKGRGCDGALICSAGLCVGSDGGSSEPARDAASVPVKKPLPTPVQRPDAGTVPVDPGPDPAPTRVECAAVRAAPRRNLYLEPELGDWPDCDDGCANRQSRAGFEFLGPVAGTRIEVLNRGYRGLQGVLDDGQHSHADGNSDQDVIRIRAPMGDLIQLTVSAEEGSCLEPQVLTLDPALQAVRGIMTAGASGPDLKRSRTLLPAPFGEDGEWYVVIADHRQFAAEAPSFGGPGFGYTLVARNLGRPVFRDFELDQGSGNQRLAGEVERAGDMHFYRVPVHVDVPHSVRLETSNGAFCGQVAQLDPTNYRWLSVGLAESEAPGTCAALVEFDLTPAFLDAEDHAWVLVTDAEGAGSNSGSGAFEYELTATREF